MASWPPMLGLVPFLLLPRQPLYNWGHMLGTGLSRRIVHASSSRRAPGPTRLVSFAADTSTCLVLILLYLGCSIHAARAALVLVHAAREHAQYTAALGMRCAAQWLYCAAYKLAIVIVVAMALHQGLLSLQGPEHQRQSLWVQCLPLPRCQPSR